MGSNYGLIYGCYLGGYFGGLLKYTRNIKKKSVRSPRMFLRFYKKIKTFLILFKRCHLYKFVQNYHYIIYQEFKNSYLKIL